MGGRRRNLGNSRGGRGAYRAFSIECFIQPMGARHRGVRSDDANDLVPQKTRRELPPPRFFGMVDTRHQRGNTPAYVEQGEAFLPHCGFREAMAHTPPKRPPRDAVVLHRVSSIQGTFASASGASVVKHRSRPLASVAVPRKHSTQSSGAGPIFCPFLEMDAADAYWAAKLVMRFDRPLLTAIVDQGQFSDPEATAHVIDTLLARRDLIGRAYLEAVSPLDEFSAGPAGLCMKDLGVTHGLAAGVVERLRGSHVLDSRAVDALGRVCLALPASDAYAVYRLRTRRGSDERRPLEVHLKGGPNARVLGIIRVVP